MYLALHDNAAERTILSVLSGGAAEVVVATASCYSLDYRLSTYSRPLFARAFVQV